MNKRHADTLKTRLESVITDGYTVITWNELYLWYNAQRLTKTVYENIGEHFDELVEAAGTSVLTNGTKCELVAYNTTDGVVLVNGARKNDSF